MNKDKNNQVQTDNDFYTLLYTGGLGRYLIMVGIRSLEYGYSDEMIFSNIDYFKRCNDFGLSAYKALLFFGDYLKGEYDI
jgi:hypothetical protein